MRPRPELMAAALSHARHGSVEFGVRDQLVRPSCFDDVDAIIGTGDETKFVQGWEVKLRDVTDRMGETLKIRQEFLRVQSQVAKLARVVDALQLKAAESHVPIQTFAPEPYDVFKPFLIVVRPIVEDDEFAACFPDANLESQGSNENEAIENLKALMLDMFDNLESKPSKKLGPGPSKQLAVLRKFIRRAE